MKTLIAPALRFFARFLLLYVVLTSLTYVPAVGGLCNRLYRMPTGPILKAVFPKAYLQIKGEGSFHETLRIEFAPKAQVEEQVAQVKKTGKAMATIEGKNNLVDFHNLFLSFFLFYVVLVFCSPIFWKEKIRAILVGTVLYYLYTVFKLYLVELIFFNEPEIAIYQTGATALKLAKGTRFCMTLGTNVLVVLLIWAVLVLKKGNWRKLLTGRS